MIKLKKYQIILRISIHLFILNINNNLILIIYYYFYMIINRKKLYYQISKKNNYKINIVINI